MIMDSILFSVLFFISCLLNVILFIKARNIYAKFNNLSLDPINEDSHIFSDETEHKVVIFGDSHALNWGLKTVNGMKCMNMGVDGQTTRQLLIRSSYQLRQHPKYIILFAGANDARCVLTLPKFRDRIVNAAFNNLTTIIKKYDNSTIFVFTIPPIFKLPYKYYFFSFNHFENAIKDLNSRIAEINYRNVIILDAYRYLSEHPHKNNLSTDGIHLNEAGYKILEELIVKEIRK